eukprot:CAMPEP_0173424730 /NCGR_PEP_ID=MMETSP1357-20121228/4603_1 /TAXON_ID=77926 /ORGANISM="Hemiselmis rufescens, Strain PCC563" /LENGTH=48 /DNA_ID= /DNA_START= /DNA_END= /DNA_ORIENTATION=
MSSISITPSPPHSSPRTLSPMDPAEATRQLTLAPPLCILDKGKQPAIE